MKKRSHFLGARASKKGVQSTIHLVVEASFMSRQNAYAQAIGLTAPAGNVIPHLPRLGRLRPLACQISRETSYWVLMWRKSFSFSAQYCSIRSVSGKRTKLNLIVKGFVKVLGSSRVSCSSMRPKLRR